MSRAAAPSVVNDSPRPASSREFHSDAIHGSMDRSLWGLPMGIPAILPMAPIGDVVGFGFDRADAFARFRKTLLRCRAAPGSAH